MIRSSPEGRSIRRRHLALALLLMGLGSCAAGGAGSARPLDGEALFRYACATCHLGRGALIGVAPPPLLLSEPLRYGDSAAALRRSIRAGTGGPFMPAFAGSLSDAEIDALVTYVRARRAAAGRGRP